MGHSSHHLKDGTFFTSFQGQWVSYFSPYSEKIPEVDYIKGKDFSQGESSQCEYHGLAEGFFCHGGPSANSLLKSPQLEAQDCASSISQVILNHLRELAILCLLIRCTVFNHMIPSRPVL